MQPDPSTIAEFNRRKSTFALRGILPMLLIILCACLLMSWAMLKHNDVAVILANLLIFLSGVVFVITAKRYYRCPVCEKVVVSTKNDGTPNEISFSIAYKPKVCPYCAAVLAQAD